MTDIVEVLRDERERWTQVMKEDRIATIERCIKAVREIAEHHTGGAERALLEAVAAIRALKDEP